LGKLFSQKEEGNFNNLASFWYDSLTHSLPLGEFPSFPRPLRERILPPRFLAPWGRGITSHLLALGGEEEGEGNTTNLPHQISIFWIN